MLGRIKDVSYEGVAITVRSPMDFTPGESVAICFAQQEEEIVLRAQPVQARPWMDSSRVGFQIMRVEQGQQTWKQLCYLPSW
jgi:hypothetical protein